MQTALNYTLIPIVATLLGVALAIGVRLHPLLVSAIQHFGAVVVFAAAAD